MKDKYNVEISKVNEMALELNPVNTLLNVKEIIELNDNVKMFKLYNKKKLPIFKAGQYITLTFKVDKGYVTRPFHLCGTPLEAQKGEYTVLVENDKEDFALKHLYKKTCIGDLLISSSPTGDFYYNGIRDCEHVIGVATGIGIAPLYAMAKAIVEGVEDFNLTIFYSEKKEKDLVLKEELKELDKLSSKVKVEFVLSLEEKENYLTGFVSLDHIKKEMKERNSFFFCGTEGLLKYLDKELEELQIPKKFIRYENFLPKCNIKKVSEYSLTIHINDEKYTTKCFNNKTLMCAIEELGMYIPSRCRNGSCGFCRSELIKGKVKVINDKRNEADKKYNFIHPCCTYPLSDIEIIIR